MAKPEQRKPAPSWMLPAGAALVALTAILTAGVARAADAAGAGGDITFGRDVAPIIFDKCARCHRPGEAAPFSLLTYEDVRKRAGQIADVTHSRFMPPWLPEQGPETFVGARRLTDEELRTIRRWVDAGAPPGDEVEMPPAPKFAPGWQAGEPDLVLESPAYELAAEGRDVFRNFVVPVPIEAARWVRSIELRPDNPRVTHHARLGVDNTYESARRDAEDEEPGYPGMAWAQDPEGQLVVWAPGMAAAMGAGESAFAWPLRPKTVLVLHAHMQPTGKRESVKFRVGIRFADGPPKERPVMLRVGSRDIDIPAGAPRTVASDEYALPVDVDVHTIFPHAHALCRELRIDAHLPDGSQRTLISIDRFDEKWHDNYRYRRPVRLPRGTRLVTTFAHDNSEDNVRNPNHPPKRVVYGSGAADEMADAYLQVTAVHADQRAKLLEDYKKYELASQTVGYLKSLEVHPDDPWSIEGLASCYVRRGEPAAAVELLERRLKIGSRSAFPLVALGIARSALSDHGGAEARHREALAIDERYPLAWFGLGKALVAQKKSAPAEEAFRKAIELAPDLPEARLALADLLVQRGKLEQAAAECSAAAVTDSPDAANVHLKLGEIRTRQRRYDDALEQFTIARRLAPYTHPPKVLLSAYCFQTGDGERARALLREAYTQSPDHPVPPLYLGQIALRDQDTDGARKYLAEAASKPAPENWPESHRARFLVLLHAQQFQLAQQLNDVDMAQDVLRQWMKVEPQNAQLPKMLEQLDRMSAAKPHG